MAFENQGRTIKFIMNETIYQLRWILYCKHHSRSLEVGEDENMTDYIIWIRKKWTEWEQATKKSRYNGNAHDEFNEWLKISINADIILSNHNQ